ncbi:DoxX family protein [Pukyongiella litopenaei]|uniref:DoxX family protein n=1 Tax=Pukyongiella litopenaei TaxID=2605946 RepID=A0A2S0MU08_9RHOB|nr:DoxX family protein [Pukyongiella litopenaei]AVO39358.1 DoxX family protein [Pukyongiella litopenaei]
MTRPPVEPTRTGARIADLLLPTLARFTFAAVLMIYFWSSAMTKLGDGLSGLLRPSAGAYVQIFPRAMEAVSYDTSQLGWFHWAVVVAGMWAEFILPALILIGLFTRLGALAMIGFVIVQSLTDIVGHGMSDTKTLGALFDRFPDGVIMDQRMLWIMVLLVLVIKGGGPLSVDRLIGWRY